MIYKVGILGVTGRMGLELSALLAEGFRYGQDVFELSDAIAGSGKVKSIEGVPVRKVGDAPREPVHVWIDFSRPAGTISLLKEIDTPLVVCTTGFDAGQSEKIRIYSERKPVLLAPNTSPGMNVVTNFLRTLPPRAVLSEFDVILREEHHKHKKDSPSGTAKALAEELQQAGYPPSEILVTRAGGIQGTHTVKLVSGDEEITIEHRVMDRRVFGRGALLAAHFLMGKRDQPGLYSISDVFG